MSSSPFSQRQKRPQDPCFSFVIPAYKEGAHLKEFLLSLRKILTNLKIRHELLIVDDGSPDNTYAVIEEMGKIMPLKYVRFSRNFGKENALTAGLQFCTGDAAILMDSDGQHPVALIETFINHWREGQDMVYGILQNRHHDGYLKRSLTGLFYKLLALDSSVPIEPNAGDFRLLDRKVINALNALPERTRFMKGLYAWVGFKSLGIPFEPTRRLGGKSRYNFRKLSNLAILGLTSFSTLPLRIIMILGILASCVSFAYGTFIVASTLLFGADLPGWSTVVTGILFLGGIQLIAVGILGEYVGHIFTEVKQRPNYILDELVEFKEKKRTGS